MTAPHVYRMEQSDLDEHHRDPFGKFWHPSKLGIDLCSTCDSIIVSGECPSCATEALLDLTVKQITGERPPLEQLTEVYGDPLKRRAA